MVVLSVGFASLGAAPMVEAYGSYKQTTVAANTNACTDPIKTGLEQGSDLQFNFDYVDQCTRSHDSVTSNVNPSTTQQTQPSGGQGANGNTVNLYAALGDSVAAGLGLPQSSDSDPACGVSAQAYPDYIAGSLGLSYMKLACSGATAGDLVTEQHLSGTSRDLEPQLDRAFAYGTPQVITITAGANDLYWQTYARKCYVSTCGTDTDQAVVDSLRSVLALKLAYALQTIQNRSAGSPPRVVLTGYYQPFSMECAAQQTSVTSTEVNWLNTQLRALNQTIANEVSAYAFAHYAPVDFSGHELCTAQSWVQGLDDPAPLHPTADGQWAIANAILPYIR